MMMHKLIHTVSPGQKHVVGLTKQAKLSWITLLSLEVCVQIIAVDLLMHSNLLWCTNFITYLSKQSAKGREKRGRKKDRETLSHCMFSWRNTDTIDLTGFLSFGTGTSNCLDKLCLANRSTKSPLPHCLFHGVSYSTILVSLIVLHCHWVTVIPVCENENMPTLIRAYNTCDSWRSQRILTLKWNFIAFVGSLRPICSLRKTYLCQDLAYLCCAGWEQKRIPNMPHSSGVQLRFCL